MKTAEIRADLIHLGMNITTRAAAKDPLACDDEEWRFLTDRMAEKGFNMVLIDLNEGVRYDSHPEIGVRGAWSVGKLCRELARLRSIGLEPIPKLNFSAMHDEWLGDWGRMVSTPEYYRVCEDLIREVSEIFSRPRLFHLGFDEEDVRNQSNHEYMVLRQGELWWHDLLWFVRTVEKTGSRAWIWSDYIWERHDEFLKRMPRSVLQSNWYYDDGFDERAFRWPRIRCYLDMDRAGFEQVPTGSNFVTPVNVAQMVTFAREHLDPSRLKGFLGTSWLRTLPENRSRHAAVIDALGGSFMV